MFEFFKRKTTAVSPQVRQVRGVDTYGFPIELTAHPLLNSMGPDYVDVLVAKISEGLLKQDPGTNILAIQCLQLPNLETMLNGASHVITGVSLAIPIQALVQDSNQAHWRLNGVANFLQKSDSIESTNTGFNFEIQSSEQL